MNWFAKGRSQSKVMMKLYGHTVQEIHLIQTKYSDEVYNGGFWENIFGSINKLLKHLYQKYYTIIFYIRESWTTVELFQYA